MLIPCYTGCCLFVEIKLTMRAVTVYELAHEDQDTRTSLAYQSNSHSSPILLSSNWKVSCNL